MYKSYVSTYLGNKPSSTNDNAKLQYKLEVARGEAKGKSTIYHPLHGKSKGSESAMHRGRRTARTKL